MFSNNESHNRKWIAPILFLFFFFHPKTEWKKEKEKPKIDCVDIEFIAFMNEKKKRKKN